MKNNTTWIKKRHRVATDILYRVMTRPFLVPHYFKHDKKIDFDGAAIVLSNHVTGLDQFLVQDLFKRNLYFVGTEDVFSNGIIGKFLKYNFNPISKTKSLTDFVCTKNCLQVIKEGGLVCIFPEGNRTYSGELCDINPAITKLIKKSNAKLVLCNIAKGYSLQPRWADKKRRTEGSKSYIKKILEPSEIAAMDDDKLYREILDNLNVNEFETPSISYSKNRAEYLERVLYICPDCGAISSISSNGEMIECSHCHRKYIYNEKLELIPQQNDTKMHSLLDWYRYQEDYIINTPLEEFDDFKFMDSKITLKKVIQNKNKVVQIKGFIRMNNKVVEVYDEEKTIVFSLDNIISFTCCGKNKLNFYTTQKHIYQIKGSKRFNALKYMQLFYKVLNIKEGKPYDRFLGL